MAASAHIASSALEDEEEEEEEYEYDDEDDFAVGRGGLGITGARDLGQDDDDDDDDDEEEDEDEEEDDDEEGLYSLRPSDLQNIANVPSLEALRARLEQATPRPAGHQHPRLHHHRRHHCRHRLLHRRHRRHCHHRLQHRQRRPQRQRHRPPHRLRARRHHPEVAFAQPQARREEEARATQIPAGISLGAEARARLAARRADEAAGPPAELVGDPDEGLDPSEHGGGEAAAEVERTQTDHLNQSLLASFKASLDRMGMQAACPMLGGFSSAPGAPAPIDDFGDDDPGPEREDRV